MTGCNCDPGPEGQHQWYCGLDLTEVLISPPEEHPLYNGDCGYGVAPEEWHHGVAGPPMTDAPADRCER